MNGVPLNGPTLTHNALNSDRGQHACLKLNFARTQFPVMI
uniref:Uncharacterized protein n=1 Tax=Anguilla anguilla TaxID=7936 RepID=A0A0E9TVN2_ANGAN